ncbi:hypothetical protein NJG16_00350 [Stenotrophomonas maltophilia]|uniref:hypothetical protein n=1 Tax=Stenotrophomonas lactitubi TaxID=2045214 RepID=UPI002040742A|nr:hypothetical protein [Stenotrophomonas lactitubi]MCO7468516.1 hypothetical protein [Stenotrophomonas maltophilia]
MERPGFPCFPTAYAISFEEVAGVYDSCGELRTLRYQCFFDAAWFKLLNFNGIFRIPGIASGFAAPRGDPRLVRDAPSAP